MDLRFHEEASVELEAAGDWYENQRSGLAADFLDEVRRALDVVREQSDLCPGWPGIELAKESRCLVLPRYPP